MDQGKGLTDITSPSLPVSISVSSLRRLALCPILFNIVFLLVYPTQHPQTFQAHLKHALSRLVSFVRSLLIYRMQGPTLPYLICPLLLYPLRCRGTMAGSPLFFSLVVHT